MIATQYHPRVNAPASKGGFALIISMVLMGFILLLLLSLSALTRVETEVAGTDELRGQARMNALLGLNVALAQLQEFTGADRRVTATAAMERNDAGAVMTPANGTRHWTAAWGNGEGPASLSSTPVFLNWLVSGNENRKAQVRSDGSIETVTGTLSFKPDGSVPTLSADTLPTDQLAQGSQSWRLLVGRNSVTDVADYVAAPLVPLQGEQGSTTGGYAYWIADEGVKAALHPVEDASLLHPEADEAEAKARLRYRTPGRTGAEALDEDWITALSAVADASSAEGAALRSELERIVQQNQLNLLTGLPADFAHDHFHDATIWSYGVLSDTLGGGLRKDLTAAFAAGTDKDTAPTGLIWEDIKASVNSMAPFWQSLRSWYQYADQAGESLPIMKTDWEGRQPLAPVVVGWQWFVQALVAFEGNDSSGQPTYRLGYRMYPALTLWNPYNVTLEGATLEGRYANNAIVTSGKRGASRRVTFTTRVWENTFGGSDDAFPSAYVAEAQYIAPWSRVSEGSNPAPFRFTVDTGDMAPGMAYVYALPEDVTYPNNFSDTSSPPSAGAPNHPERYKLERGFIGSSGTYAAVVAWSPDVFTLPAGKTAVDYQIGFWIGSGSSGDAVNMVKYTDNVRFEDVDGSDKWGIVGNDAFELDELGGSGSLRLQAIYGINASLRLATVNEMWAESEAPLLEDVLADSSGSIGFYGQRWALKVTEAAAAVFPVTGSEEFNKPVRWLANYNPRASFSDRTPFERQVSGGYYNTNASYNRATTLSARAGRNFDHNAAWFQINHDGATGAAHTGLSQNPYSVEPEPVILFDVPRPDTRILSIGALQHASIFRPTSSEAYMWATNTAPAYVIGNSLADPRIGLERYRVKPGDISSSGASGYSSNDYMVDYSYVLNRVLWDGYYFSSVPQGAAAVSFPLDNSRYVRYGDPADADLKDYEKSAANLLVKGAFNVNSASPAAWRALLASFNEVAVNGEAMAQKSAFPRQANPAEGLFNPDAAGISDASAEVAAYNGGFRALSKAQINLLADKIVDQVRLRGPFLSLADFVNRSLLEPEETQLMGALAAALKEAEINSKFEGAEVELKTEGVTTTIKMNSKAYDGASAEYVPGWLSQADLLQSLGPVLSARSDTFVIRVSGEASRPGQDGATAFAWCEAVVQRLPEYSNGDAPHAAPTQANQSMGRSFRIVSLRWLSADDI